MKRIRYGFLLLFVGGFAVSSTAFADNRRSSNDEFVSDCRGRLQRYCEPPGRDFEGEFLFRDRARRNHDRRFHRSNRARPSFDPDVIDSHGWSTSAGVTGYNVLGGNNRAERRARRQRR